VILNQVLKRPELRMMMTMMPRELGMMEIADGTVNPQAPELSSNSRVEYTGGSEFRERILFVVISTEPVLERSYAIELGGRFGNIA
jgi:hypothetical protein